MEIVNQQIQLPTLVKNHVSLFIKREDQIHAIISGNKFRKLHYNLIALKELGLTTILTFGGAFSNHIAATAKIGKEHGIKTIGIIRGDELAHQWETNPTLKLAASSGMELLFIDRETYRNKNSNHFIEFLKGKFGRFYLLPEGGTNALAVKGCEAILTPNDAEFDLICCAVGTGGTLAGLINAAHPHQKILGFTALKGDFLMKDIRKFVQHENWQLVEDYHFGGYAKINNKLVQFINAFKKETDILLDPIYTGKMLFGLFDMIEKGIFKKPTKILAIHTGGLQGIVGMNLLLQKKKLPVIDL